MHLNFRQQEENHIMENILYNELTACGFSVDVVETTVTNSAGNRQRSQPEVDFVCQRDHGRYYIQSALTVADENKRLQEINSLTKINDSFIKNSCGEGLYHTMARRDRNFIYRYRRLPTQLYQSDGVIMLTNYIDHAISSRIYGLHQPTLQDN